MKNMMITMGLVALSGCLPGMWQGEKTPEMEAYAPQVCRMTNPSDVVTPEFSWKLRSERKGAAQSMAVIRVMRGEAKMPVFEQIVPGRQTTFVKYTGPALEEAAKYYWSVTPRDEKGEWLPSVGGEFITGLSDTNLWNCAEWIDVPSSKEVTKEERDMQRSAAGTSCFVKCLAFTNTVKEAIWSVTANGCFDVFVNGKRVGDDVLKPGFTCGIVGTAFNSGHAWHNSQSGVKGQQRRHTFTYDVTQLLNGQKNVFAAEVSSGWWRDQCIGYAGKRSAFRGVLTVRYADGTEERFGTSTNWLGAVAGRVKRASIFEGEVYDARESDDWKVAQGLDGFAPTGLNNEFIGLMLPMVGEKIRQRDDIKLLPAKQTIWRGVTGESTNCFGKVKILREPPCGEAFVLEPGETLVVDFAQNSAAVPCFRFSAKAGSTMECRLGEMLNDNNGEKARGNDGPEGSVYRVNLRGFPKCANNYMCSYTFAGNGVETYRPRFTFFGYRYASITVTAPTVFERIASVPVTSISRNNETGSITTDNELLNRLVQNVIWGQRSNYLSVPTDCPQRNERQGWCADTQVFSKTASYNADVSGFLTKWMDDMRDTMSTDGSFPSVAPFGQYGHAGYWRLAWSDAGIVVPYTIWQQFGDKNIVAQNWEAMEEFMTAIDSFNYKVNTTKGNFQFADWLSYEKYERCSGRSHENAEGKRVKDVLPETLEYENYLAGCHWLVNAQMMQQMAIALGKKDATQKYAKMATRAHSYLIKEFIAKDGMLKPYMRNMQTPALFAVRLNLVTGAARTATINEFIKNMREHDGCLQTGFVGAGIIMDTLTYDFAQPELAYTLLLQRKNPSWLYSVDNGATTIWERWNSYRKDTGFGPVSMNSFNHYAYGSVMAWMYGTMAGIRADQTAPGWSHFILAPMPDRRVGKVCGNFDSPCGLIKSCWKFDEGKWTWCFTIPANTSATVINPFTHESREYPSGNYTIVKE